MTTHFRPTLANLIGDTSLRRNYKLRRYQIVGFCVTPCYPHTRNSRKSTIFCYIPSCRRISNHKLTRGDRRNTKDIVIILAEISVPSSGQRRRNSTIIIPPIVLKRLYIRSRIVNNRNSFRPTDKPGRCNPRTYKVFWRV